jgi:ABC-type transport system involved in multi-copper enzyme maturation permease subunit
MNEFINTIRAEILKLRRAWFFRIVWVLFILIPFMLSMVFFVALHPETAGEFGLASSKAGMAQMGEPGWDSFFKTMLQGFAGIGLVGTGFVASWLFGREFALGTAKDLLALPVSRTTMVLAKFTVIFFWNAFLGITFYAAGLLFGWIIGLGTVPETVFWNYTNTFAVTLVLSMHLCSVAAFLASSSRGYMLPIGFVILMVIFTNFAGMIGIAPYFPWAVPGLYAVTSSDLHLLSYVLLACMCIAGYAGTVVFWKRADHK